MTWCVVIVCAMAKLNCQLHPWMLPEVFADTFRYKVAITLPRLISLKKVKIITAYNSC